jgi:arsenate reductase
MQKAFALLEAKNVKHDFHNYKISGIDRETLELWLQHFPTDKLINTKGTSYRALSDKEKASIGDKEKAIALMIKNPSLIKRPVWDLGKGKFYLGYDETELAKLL